MTSTLYTHIFLIDRNIPCQTAELTGNVFRNRIVQAPAKLVMCKKNETQTHTKLRFLTLTWGDGGGKQASYFST